MTSSALSPSVIILESSEEERVPTDDEVNEYAEFLGLDPNTEEHLMWIARDGVIAQVPPPWKACTENGDDVFYFNFDSGESVWDHPSDEKFRQLVEQHRNQPAEACARIPEESCAVTSPTSSSIDQGINTSATSPTSPSVDKGNTSAASLESSSVELPMDNLDSLLAGAAADKSKLSKAQGGLLELGPMSKTANGNQLPKALPALEESRRLELITNEISDEDVISESSAMGSPSGSAAAGAGTSPAKIDRNRGSAGVGLAAAGGLAIDTSLDRSGELGDRSMESAESAKSSPVATSASASGAPSQSGGRSALPLGPRSAGSGEGRLGVLERSGQSGKSSNLSEVSEDFPSDFDGSHTETSPRVGGVRTPLGDSLEMSATIDETGPTSLAAAILAMGAASASSPEPAGGELFTQDSKQGSSRLSKVQGDLDSLAKVLGKLRQIREQQREYLHLLQSGG